MAAATLKWLKVSPAAPTAKLRRMQVFRQVMRVPRLRQTVNATRGGAMQSAAASAGSGGGSGRRRQRAAQNSWPLALLPANILCVPAAAAFERRCPLLAAQQRRQRHLPPLQKRTVRLSSGARTVADVCKVCICTEMHQRGGAAAHAADGSGPCNRRQSCSTLLSPPATMSGSRVHKM